MVMVFRVVLLLKGQVMELVKVSEEVKVFLVISLSDFLNLKLPKKIHRN